MIEKILILSLLVWAIYITMQEDMIFEKFGLWLEGWVPEKLQPPIFSCPICMGFWHGSYLYWIIWGGSVKEWLICVVAVIGLNAIIDRFLDALKID